MLEILQFASESVPHAIIVVTFFAACVTAVINFKPIEISIVYGNDPYRDDDKNE